MQIAIAKRPFLNEQYCGDECAWWQRGDEVVLCVIDGLGHGAEAHRAAQAALDYVSGHLSLSLPEIFAGCDQAIRHTRGVVMGIAVFHEPSGTLTYAGVGNLRMLIVRKCPAAPLSRDIVRLPSSAGTVGFKYSRIFPETVPLNPGSVGLLYTDGLPESLDMAIYKEDWCQGELQKLADRIIQEWGRETDDAAILAFRNEDER